MRYYVAKVVDGKERRIYSWHRKMECAQRAKGALMVGSGIKGLQVISYGAKSGQPTPPPMDDRETEPVAKKQPRHLEFRQQVRDQEACRVTLIHCLNMLKTLREKLPNACPEGSDPHGIWKSWLGTAERNLEMLLQAVVDNEL